MPSGSSDSQSTAGVGQALQKGREMITFRKTGWINGGAPIGAPLHPAEAPR